MVRLTDLQTVIEVCGTTGHALGGGAIPDGMVRRVYRVRLQQRGATLGNVYFHGVLGATLGATLDQIKFDTTNQIIDQPGEPLLENSLPIWKDIDRATYDGIFVSVEVASVDVFIQYADENP